MSSSQNGSFDRVVWIVLDGVGAGALPDAKLYGDLGANTLGNLSRALRQKTGRPLKLPNLEALGIGSITSMEGVEPLKPGQKGGGAFGRALEQSRGKDTTSGHWEMAGLPVLKPFTVYPDGFSEGVVQRWVNENGLPGVLGNKAASGTEIIEEYGEEHLRTGKPILYTSADSVWQVAAHEEAFGLERLYKVCKSARKICDELQIGRVIARPFVGDPSKGVPFKRTYHRKDYSQLPPAPTVLDHLQAHGVPTLGIGKISAIFGAQGIDRNIDTEGNAHGIVTTLEQVQAVKRGLIYVNLIDFDMLYGHRRDVEGFATAIEDFDAALAGIRNQLGPRDLLLLTADHGNDPTFPGSDHTREYAPILAYTQAQSSAGAIDLGTRDSFADMGATVAEALLPNVPLPPGTAGKSFLPELLKGST